MKRIKKVSRDIFSKAIENMKPPADLTVSEWAEKYRVLSRESSAEAGPWNNSRTPYLVEVMDSFTDPRVEQITFVSSSQIGKALHIETPILTMNGWKTMREIEQGDIVFDENGKRCNVIGTTPIMYDRKCYKLTFSDGSEIVADAEHKWYVESYNAINYDGRKGVYKGVVTTEEISKNFKIISKNGSVRNNYAIPVNGPVEFDEAHFSLPPYVLGVWLGDGNSCSNQVTTAESDYEIIKHIEAEGIPVTVRKKSDGVLNTIIMPKASIHDMRYCIRGHDMNAVGRTKKGLCAECARQYSSHFQYGKPVDPVINRQVTGYKLLYDLDLINNKHIPTEYLKGSYHQRLSLLQGIMDTDGTISESGRCEIILKSKKLIEGVSELLHSLGIKHTLKTKIAVCTNSENGYSCEVYRISFMVYDDKPVFRLKRKLDRMVSKNSTGKNGMLRRTSETFRRRIVNVEEIQSVPVKCISVDSESHLYLAGKSLIPTHNSEIELNIIGYIIDQDPGSVLYIQPTIEDAKKFSRQRIAPMIRDSRTLRTKVADVKSRDSGNTILQKTFPGGMLTMVGSNSASALASTPVKYVIGDELDRWALSAGTEGDPWGLAQARTTTFYNSKMVAVSTPTVKDASKIADLYSEGTQERWCVECPECGEYHDITFDDIKFDFDTIKKGRKKDYKIKSVYWCCPSCGCYSDERTIKKQPFKWIAKYPDAYERGHRSFWLNAFASPWQTWEKICYSFLMARNDPEALKVVFNTMLGELWEDRGDLIDEDTLLSRREPYGESDDGIPIELPDGVLVLTCAVDTQDDRIEYEVRGWGRYFETWGIKKSFIPGDPDEEYVWLKLDEVIDREYRFADGKTLKPAITFVDSGGHKTQSVYKQCRARLGKRVFAIKGKGGEDIPFTKPPSKVDIVVDGRAIAKTWLYNLGVDSGKTSILKGMLNVLEPGAKYCHFPKESDRGYDLQYFNGLLSEKLVAKTQRGQTKYVWEKMPGHERNEPLDLFNYNLAAVTVLSPDMDKEERQLKGWKKPEQKQTVKPEVKKPKPKKNKLFDAW